MPSTVYDLLKKLEIFAGIPEEMLHDFAGRLELKGFPSGTTIIQKGEHGDSMFVIASGRVKIHDGDHTVDRKSVV